VGAPRCGTTALHTYLGQHPEIFMAKEKMEGVENNHFATDLIPLTDPFRSDERYFAMFKDAGDKRIVGESSVYYMLSKTAARNIYRFNPNSRIIIMLRNPVDMLPSFHAQLVYNRDEDIIDFEAALEAETRRKNGKLKIKDGLRFNERLFYSEVVSYTEQVQRYLSLFPREQVLVIIYDDFKEDTAAVYQETLEFLNIDPTFQPDFPIINSRKAISAGGSTHQRERKNILRGVIELPSLKFTLISKMIPESLHKYLQRGMKGPEPVNQANQHDAPMNPRTRKQLQRKYRPEVERLTTLIGRDLNGWCGHEMQVIKVKPVKK
jgi:hypothetical protein